MKKKWDVLPLIKKKRGDGKSSLNSLVQQLLYNRGLTKRSEIDDFFSDDYDKLDIDPFLFKDMKEATRIIIGHIKKKHKIVVYGDYDADGVTSSVLLYEVLSILNAKVGAYIPDRISEGYGLNRSALEKIADSGVKLVITVDGGIRSKEEVIFARSLGLDVIITDHHVPPPGDKDLPDAPIINPALKNEIYPFKFLAGVGVAYKLAKALISKAKIDSALKVKIEERIVDLVGIGTIADMVSLLGENRNLVKQGLRAINRTKRVGLKELIKITGINKYGRLKAWNVGFQIAPRINAAGRMKHANIAFDFLTAKDEKQARALAVSLNNNNIERQRETEKMIEEAREMIGENPKDHILVMVDERKPADSWNEGLIGLVAGRINDFYYRPALVITRTEKGYKGSGRSIPDFNLIKNLEACSDLLDKYGGHPLACGFSVKKENFELFIKCIKSKARAKLKDLDLRPHIKIDKELKASEINIEMVNELAGFEPFGQHNQCPKFVTYGLEVVDILIMGKESQHIKFRLQGDNARPIGAVAFNQAEKLSEIKLEEKIDLVYYLELDTFNGGRDPLMKVVDLKVRNDG